MPLAQVSEVTQSLLSNSGGEVFPWPSLDFRYSQELHRSTNVCVSEIEFMGFHCGSRKYDDNGSGPSYAQPDCQGCSPTCPSHRNVEST